jgi:hypothetical protein
VIRAPLRVLAGIYLLAVTLVTAPAARAAGEVVVSASPAAVRVGQPLEILIRTFIAITREGTLAVPDPRGPYPGPSGLYDVLYPWDDYPFDAVAEHEDGTEVHVTVSRDPSDSTLWRGITYLPKAGAWTIWVRNFPNTKPGSTTVVMAEAASSTDDPRAAGPPAVIGVLFGLIGGFVLARVASRRRSS